MLRLSVIGGPKIRWHAVASRFPDLALLTEETSPETCDAAIFPGPQPADGSAIAHFLNAGKHVLLSADNVFSKELLQTLSGLAQQNRVHLMIANPDRYLPSRKLIRQQLDAGNLGEPGLIRVHRWELANAETGSNNVYLCDIDLVLWYFGKPPSRVYAVANQSMQIHLGFPGGGMALLDHAPRFPAGVGYYALSVIASSGTVSVDDHHNMQLVYQGGSPRAIRTDEGVQQWSALMQEFVDVLAVGQDADPVMPTSATKAWQNVLTVAEAVQQSLRTHQSVRPEGWL